MRLRLGALALGCLLVVGRAAAQEPQPGAWKMSPSLAGASVDDLFEIHFTPTGTTIDWVPQGKVAVSWGSIVMLRDGSIEFHRAGDSTASCTLQRIDERSYKGMCQGFGFTREPSDIDAKSLSGRCVVTCFGCRLSHFVAGARDFVRSLCVEPPGRSQLR